MFPDIRSETVVQNEGFSIRSTFAETLAPGFPHPVEGVREISIYFSSHSLKRSMPWPGLSFHRDPFQSTTSFCRLDTRFWEGIEIVNDLGVSVRSLPCWMGVGTFEKTPAFASMM
jgi:hypothetical protein